MKYETWEDTEIARTALDRLFILMCEIKPGAKAAKEVIDAWDAEMKFVRGWVIELHYARIAINQQRQKCLRNKT